MIEGRLVFSRKDLQDLREATMRKEEEELADKIVQQIKTAVLNTAMRTENKTYFYSFNYSSFAAMSRSEREIRMGLLIDVILRSIMNIFPDVTILHKRQECLQTGRLLNEGIHIDWS